ncbi:ATP-binding protein [Methanimicrococcus blatticola]|uniref:Helicase HerA central domain-containing protein n=1 Tax=Methanimicrococcus blatticola TaxID=91560 RepID=A0A484F4G9_9EURY|nr:ATP-binding protein [Methanimicrococcus blatticola]MBZ3935409.1 ATP-binding protein [Methanimicrococcus blatticola]MCC2508493.1 ATP-binding protein [Methanimicrococcus blatticola]TDQ67802.1 hypothetical protein C7391_1355 [Methanimicrococcus blatticola]
MSFEQNENKSNAFDFDKFEQDLEKQAFQEFDDYDDDKSTPVETIESQKDLEEAYGIVTTGVEPIEIAGTASKIIGYIAAAQREKARLGTYVIVPYENENLFGKFTKLQYRQEFTVDDATEIHSNRMLANKRDISAGRRINEEDYKLLALIEPICILYEKNKKEGLQRRMADRIPKPNTPILPVFDKEMVQTGLNIPKEGIFLGHLSVGGELVKTHSVPPTVAYYMRNDYSSGDPLIFRHMLVCGSTGTGKTFLTKNILRQFETENSRYRQRSDHSIQNMPCLVVMDPQDEYSQLYEDNQLSEADKFNFDSEKVAYGGIKTTKTFTAKVDGERYAGKSRAEQVEFTIPFSFVQYNPWILETAELTENQRNGLEILIADYFKDTKTKGKTPTYIGFKEFVEDPFNKEYYTEQTDKIHESSYGGIVRKALNKTYERIFDKDAKPITELFKTVFKPGQVSVFPTEYINNSRIRDLIVLTMMTVIVDNKLNTSGDEDVKNTPIILVLDEAHRYLSSSAGTLSGKIISKFAEAAKQGRKEGLGLFLITQDPQDIETEILKQINTKIVLNLNNDAAINAVKVPLEYEKRVPYLKKGQMIIHSPDNGDIVEITGLSNCVVKHE